MFSEGDYCHSLAYSLNDANKQRAASATATANVVKLVTFAVLQADYTIYRNHCAMYLSTSTSYSLQCHDHSYPKRSAKLLPKYRAILSTPNHANAALEAGHPSGKEIYSAAIFLEPTHPNTEVVCARQWCFLEGSWNSQPSRYLT